MISVILPLFYWPSRPRRERRASRCACFHFITRTQAYSEPTMHPFRREPGFNHRLPAQPMHRAAFRSSRIEQIPDPAGRLKGSGARVCSPWRLVWKKCENLFFCELCDQCTMSEEMKPVQPLLLLTHATKTCDHGSGTCVGLSSAARNEKCKGQREMSHSRLFQVRTLLSL